jgi:hypothetical protein
MELQEIRKCSCGCRDMVSIKLEINPQCRIVERDSLHLNGIPKNLLNIQGEWMCRECGQTYTEIFQVDESGEILIN